MLLEKNFETLALSLKNQILYLTINRPQHLNALSERVLTELKEVFVSIIKNPFEHFHGVILTGAGEKAFIAGADIKAVQDMGKDKAQKFCQLGQEVTCLLEEVGIPIIACVDGFALGGGCEMAMACDFIYATEKAVFGQPEVNLGLIPGFGGTQRLMRYVGPAMAKEIIYTGRNIKVKEAKEIGLVQKVFPNKEAMIKASEETLALIKGKSPIAIWECKKAINKGEGFPLSQGLKTESESFSFVFGTEDKKEGVAAFLEKRPPHFKGK